MNNFRSLYMISRSITAAGLFLAAAIVAPAPVLAQGGQEACQGDAMRFCQEFIPDRARVAACLARHRGSLSPACRAMVKPSKARKSRRR